jgi:transcriptional regulator with XRE-family HTH domain
MAYHVTNVKELLALMKRLQGERSSTEFAADLGISKQYLSDIYNGRREPGESVLNALDLTRTVTYAAAASSPLMSVLPEEKASDKLAEERPAAPQRPERKRFWKSARARKFHP